MKRKNLFAIFSLLLLVSSTCLAQYEIHKIFYVSVQNGNDNNNGESPALAFRSFHKALIAQSHVQEPVVIIRAEGGIYKTTDGTGNPYNSNYYLLFIRNPNTDESKKLRIEGGYNFSTNIRDYAHNPTIIDGDIGNPGDPTDNSHHIAAVAGATAMADSVSIDGLQFRNGYGDTAYTDILETWYGRVRLMKDRGAGLIVNTANSKKVRITNCVFEKNRAYFGGAIYSATQINIHNCVFDSNTGESGGALYLEAIPQTTLITSCVFCRNYSGSGHAVYAGFCSIRMAQCTVYGNTGFGGAIHIHTHENSPLPASTIGNTIIWGNTTGFHFGFNKPVISNCDVQTENFGSYGYESYNNISADPAFLNTVNPQGSDGKWMTDDDGLNFYSCSPAGDKGDGNITYGVNISTDIRNHRRYYGRSVDIGAYEGDSQGIPYYYDGDRDGYGSGLAPALWITCGRPPAHYLNNNLDCNDNDSTIHPGAAELQDLKDNDCDGNVDERDITAARPAATAQTKTTSNVYVSRENSLLIFPNPVENNIINITTPVLRMENAA